MIPAAYITQWSSVAPWATRTQVEQDADASGDSRASTRGRSRAGAWSPGRSACHAEALASPPRQRRLSARRRVRANARGILRAMTADVLDDDDLYDAASAEQLWRLLVTRPSLGELAPSVAVELFTTHHGNEAPGAVDTALLLCTDRRWRRTSAAVLAGILAVRALGENELDELAQRLLWSDRVIYTHPTGWFGSTFLEFEIGEGRPGQGLGPRKVHIDPTIAMSTPRHVWPPLRKWAASRVLVSRLAEPDSLIEHARTLPARDGAAVITGVVEAADHLPPQQANAVVAIALGWGHKSPRKAALERLCSWGETERAREAAATDRDASLRGWGANLGHDAQAGLFD